MRRKFASDLYKLMKKDKNIVLVTGDMGYGMFDKTRNDLQDQFINTGAAEMAMMGIAIGLALEGKIPVVYSITPFLLYRPFEVIRNYINHEGIPVIMVGSGRGKDYNREGFSHDASDHEILRQFKNIVFMVPDKSFNLKKIIYANRPVYLNLKR
jgi:transketolase